MLEVEIPGFGRLQLKHLVLDYNGTIARDGQLLNGVAERLENLSERLEIHVVTADTFGKASAQVKDLPCRLTVIDRERQIVQKADYVRDLGLSEVVCIGNGMNDNLMLEEAALGIAVIGEEAASLRAMQAADVVAKDVLSALDLLVHPGRLIATLRS